MFDDMLIESANKESSKSGWLTAVISAAVHLGIFGALIAAGYWVKQNPQVVEKPIEAFVVSQAAPPPPPPPPPPAASHASSTPHKQKIETPKVPDNTFHQPREIPKEVPQVDPVDTPETGGVDGGVVGGQVGGVVGGVIGGVVGGVVGGTLGGQLGGQLGGTGDRPMRVAGDVQAPIRRVTIEPVYTEIARKARVEGIVIIEAIIDRQGNVTDARVLKGLPMGLDQTALEAVRRWKFSPGTLNGQPVPVIYNLSVNFRLQ